MVGQSGSTYYSNLPTAVSTAANNSVIVLHSDIRLLDKVSVVDGKVVTIDLNGHKVDFPSDSNGDGLFYVSGTGSKLTINDSVGTAVVDAKSQNNEYSMAVWAREGGEVVINGGTFTNNGADSWDEDANNGEGCGNNNELIYANGGKITINGGTYIGNYSNAYFGTRYTLNIKDNTASTIIVTAGVFRQYDPANSLSENPAGNFVDANSTSIRVEEGGIVWFVVTANN